MNSTNLFDSIVIAPPYAKIYRRLGFRKETTEISAKQQEETNAFIEEALSLIALKGVMLNTGVIRNDGKDIVLSCGLTFASKKLAKFLHGCPEALLMGATAGSLIMEGISGRMEKDNLYAAVVYDATASEMVDAALDWIMNFFNQQVRREGKKLLSRRFSAGYADFHLENQKEIYNKLQMKKLGVKITPSFILVPEKSVTAIGGVSG